MVLNGVRIYQVLIKIFQNFTKLIKNYDEDSTEGDIFEVVIEYLKYLHDMHTDLPFLPERTKINKCRKLGCNLHNKKICYSHKKLEISIESGLIL